MCSINFYFTKECIETKGASFVRDNRNNAIADFFITQQVAQQAAKCHCGRSFDLVSGSHQNIVINFVVRNRDVFRTDNTLGRETAQGIAATHKVFIFRRIKTRMEIRGKTLCFNHFIGDLFEAKGVTELLDFVKVQFLNLVCRITRCNLFTESPALNCLS